MASNDYYELLELDRSASTDDIKRQYRKLARQYHPDANPDDPDAEARFKAIAEAYAVLSDDEKRAQYDRFGSAGFDGEMFGGAGGINDIFEAFFGGANPFGGAGQSAGRAGPPRGSDLEVVVTLDFADAVLGTRTEVPVRTAVSCDTCEATGAEPGTDVKVCETCGGSGQVRQVRRSILGQMVTSGICNVCDGMGETIASRCHECAGEGRVILEKTFTIDVPAGIDNGSSLRLGGRGAVGPRGGPAGDLFVHVNVSPHPRFRRDGSNLIETIDVPMTQAALGATLDYETLDSTEELTIPPGTQSGDELRIRGRGVPSVRGRGRGDLIVRVAVTTPSKLSKREAELLRELAEERGEEVSSSDGLFSRIRSTFG